MVKLRSKKFSRNQGAEELIEEILSRAYSMVEFARLRNKSSRNEFLYSKALVDLDQYIVTYQDRSLGGKVFELYYLAQGKDNHELVSKQFKADHPEVEEFSVSYC